MSISSFSSSSSSDASSPLRIHLLLFNSCNKLDEELRWDSKRLVEWGLELSVVISDLSLSQGVMSQNCKRPSRLCVFVEINIIQLDKMINTKNSVCLFYSIAISAWQFVLSCHPLFINDPSFQFCDPFCKNSIMTWYLSSSEKGSVSITKQHIQCEQLTQSV